MTTILICFLSLDASDNNLLNALDGPYCDFEGGGDPNVDGTYPDQAPGGYKGALCSSTILFYVFIGDP